MPLMWSQSALKMYPEKSPMKIYKYKTQVIVENCIKIYIYIFVYTYTILSLVRGKNRNQCVCEIYVATSG